MCPASRAGPSRESPPCFFVDCPSIQAGRKRMGRGIPRQIPGGLPGRMESADSPTVAMNLLRELDRLETASGLVIPLRDDCHSGKRPSHGGI